MFYLTYPVYLHIYQMWKPMIQEDNSKFRNRTLVAYLR
jgi:hypothetical protein